MDTDMNIDQLQEQLEEAGWDNRALYSHALAVRLVAGLREAIHEGSPAGLRGALNSLVLLRHATTAGLHPQETTTDPAEHPERYVVEIAAHVLEYGPELVFEEGAEDAATRYLVAIAPGGGAQ